MNWKKLSVPLEDMLAFNGKQHFSSFENIGGKINFISDKII